jgi:hypothetical protein
MTRMAWGWKRDAAAKMVSGTACSGTVDHGKTLLEDCGDQSYCSGIAPANCKRTSGRPTTSRDKAPYEEKTKRSRFCTICRKEGHKCTTCPDRGDIPKAPRKEPKCTKCGVIGYRRNVCGKPTDPFEPNFFFLRKASLYSKSHTQYKTPARTSTLNMYTSTNITAVLCKETPGKQKITENPSQGVIFILSYSIVAQILLFFIAVVERA